MAAPIKQSIIQEFKSKGAKSSVQDLDQLGRAQTRLGNSSTATGRAFAAQSKGLGGLVAAYAGAAATIFALQQAFSALNQAAKNEQLIQGTRTLASAVGESGDKILSSITKITKAQISLAAVSEQTNAALAAGFSGAQIEQLANVATKASKALGRDLTDAFSRLVRGAGKLEPELLDELGIFTRLEHSVGIYAAQIGKTSTQLTQFERRQAFVNSVIEEGNRKFTSISVSEASAAQNLAKLVATLSNLGQAIGLFIAHALNPLVVFFNDNLFNSIALFGLLAKTVFGKAVSLMQDGAVSLSKSLEESNLKIAKFFTSTKQLKELVNVQKAAEAIALNTVGGKANAPLKAAIIAARDGTTFAEALALKQVAEIKVAENKARLDVIASKLANPSSRMGQAGKDALSLEQTKKTDQNKLLNDTILTTNAAIKSQAPVAKGLQSTLTGISTAFSWLLNLGSKVLFWAGAAITAFSLLQLILDKFELSDTFDAIITAMGKGIANFFGFTESVKKTEQSVASLNQAIFNMLAATDKIDITKGKGIKTQGILAKALGLEPESIKFTEELVNKELISLNKKFVDNAEKRAEAVAQANANAKKRTGNRNTQLAPEQLKTIADDKDKSIESALMRESDANLQAISALQKKYSELNLTGQKLLDTMIRTIESSNQLRQDGPAALADLQTAAEETGISFEKLYKSYSIKNNELKSTDEFLPGFTPDITSYLEFNKLREIGARQEIIRKQEINEQELAFIRLQNVAIDLKADILTGLASEEALSTKLGALRNVELEILKQIKEIKAPTIADEEAIRIYTDQIKVLRERLDLFERTSRAVRAQAEFQITVSQHTDQLKKSFSEEFNLASQITGLLSKQSVFAGSALEIRTNELEQLSNTLTLTKDVRKLDGDGVVLKAEQLALNRAGIAAEQILFGLAVKVAQEQKKALEELKKQDVDAKNKLRAAQLQQELVILQNQQKYSELAFTAAENELHIKEQQLDIAQKIEEINIRAANLLKKTNLGLLSDLASGPLSNLFSGSDNKNIEISIAQNDLDELKKINDSQIALARQKAETDKALILNEVARELSRNRFQIDLIKKQEQIAKDRLRAELANYNIEQIILDEKFRLLKEEALQLQEHGNRLETIFAQDIIRRQALITLQKEVDKDALGSTTKTELVEQDTRLKSLIRDMVEIAKTVEGPKAAKAEALEFARKQAEMEKLRASAQKNIRASIATEVKTAEQNAKDQITFENKVTSDFENNAVDRAKIIDQQLNAQIKAAEEEVSIRQKTLDKLKKIAEFESDLFVQTVNILFGELRKAIKESSDSLGKALVSGEGVGKALFSFGNNLRTAFVDSAGGALSLSIQKYVEKSIITPIQDEFLSAFGLDTNAIKSPQERLVDLTEKVEGHTRIMSEKIAGKTGAVARAALNPTVKGLTALAFATSTYFENKIKDESEAVTKAQEREGIAKEQLTKITESHKTAIQNEKTALDAVRNSVKARTEAEKDLQKVIGSGLEGYSAAVDSFITTAKELQINDNAYSLAASRTVQLGIMKQAQEDIVKSATEERIAAEKRLASTQKISSIAISALTVAIGQFSNASQQAARNIIGAAGAVAGAGASGSATGGIVGAITGGFSDAGGILKNIGTSVLSEIGKKLFNFDSVINGLADSIGGFFGIGGGFSAGATAAAEAALFAEGAIGASATLGGAAAFSVASVLPYIGLVIGALSLFGVFKKKESVGPNANASGKLVNGRYVQTDSGADNGGDRGAVEKMTEAAGTALKNIQDIFSIKFAGGESPQLRTGYFKGKYFGGVTDPAGGSNHFERGNFDSAEDAVAFAIAATLKQAADKGTLRASKDITDAIKYLDLSEAKTFAAEKFQEVLEFSANFGQLLDKLNNVALTATNLAEFAAKSASARIRGIFSEISDILTKTTEIFGEASTQFVAAQNASQNYILQTLGLQKNNGNFEAFQRNKDTVGAYQFRLAEVNSTFTAGSEANLSYREGLKKTGLNDTQIDAIFTDANKQKVIQQLGKEFYESVSNGLNPGREAAIAFAEDTARYLVDAQALYTAGAITAAQYEDAKKLAQERYNEVVAATQKEIEDLTRKLQDAAIATNQAKVDLRDFAMNLKDQVIPELQEGLRQTRDAIRGLASDLVSQFQSATDKLYGIFDSTTKALEDATQARKDVESKYGIDSTRNLDQEIAQKQARLQELSTELAGGMSVNTLSDFVAYSRKAAELRQLSVDVPKLTAAKKEIDAARNKEAQLTGDLAFVTKELNDTGLDLVTQRYSESEIVKDTRKAVEEFTQAQKELGQAIYEIATNDATKNLIDINEALLDVDNKVYKVNAGFGTFITRSDGVYDELQKGATANKALAAIFKVSTERGEQLNTVLEGVTLSTLEAYTVLENGLNPAFVDAASDAETLRRALDQPNEGLTDSFQKLKDLIGGSSGLVQQTEDLGNAQAALILVENDLKNTIRDLTVGAREVNPYINDLRDKLNGVRDAINAENGVSNELDTAKNKLLELANAVTTLPGDLGAALRTAIQAATDPTYFINQFQLLTNQLAALSPEDQAKYRNVSGGDPYYSQATDAGVQRVGSIVRARDSLISRISDPNQIQSILTNTYNDSATNRNMDLGAVGLRNRYAQLTGSTLPNIGEFASLASGAVTSTSAAISRGEAPVSDYNGLITQRNAILNRYNDAELQLVDRTYYGGALYGTAGSSSDKRFTFFTNLAGRDISDIAAIQANYNAATSGDISGFTALTQQAGAPNLTAAGYQSLVNQRNALLNSYNPTQLRGVYNAYYANTLPGVDPTNKSGFIAALGVQDNVTLQNLNAKPAGYNPNYGFSEFQDVANQFTTLGVAGANIYAANPGATGQEAMWYSTNDYTTRRVGEIIRNRNNILSNITSMGQLQNIIQTYGYATSSDPAAEAARNRLGFLQSNYPAAYASGGSVMRRDRVNAMLEPGEFVMRKHAVDQIGRDNLTEINSTGRVNSGNVEINIVNNGTAQEVEGVPVTRRDGDKLIVDVILRDLRNNGPVARKIKTGMR